MVVSLTIVAGLTRVHEWSFAFFFFFKQKTAYEMRISDWSSDVCSSDLPDGGADRTDLVLRTAGWRMSDSQTPAGSVKPDYRTPIGRARGLGSAKSGTAHFWWQRVTAVVLALLVPWLVGTLVDRKSVV